MYTDETSDTPWTYQQTAAWNNVDTRFSACAGGMQSPIDLFQFSIAPDTSPLVLPQYKAGQLLLRNTGQYLRIVNNFGSLMYLGDKIYDLVYMQVKTPSEHRMSGEQYPVEVQWYHRAVEDGSITAVSLLYKLGPRNTFLDMLIENAPTGTGTEFLTKSSINLGDALPKDITSLRAGPRAAYPYYTYEGSLTTPPCTEGIQWLVWAKPDHVSADQAAALQGLFPDAPQRPLHPDNDRRVQFKSLF